MRAMGQAGLVRTHRMGRYDVERWLRDVREAIEKRRETTKRGERCT